MKTVSILCTIALFIAIDGFVIDSGAAKMYHEHVNPAFEDTKLETENANQEPEADPPTELTPILAERADEQSDSSVPFLNSIPPSPFRDYYPFVEYSGLPSPAFMKRWDNVEYGAWGALRFALDQAPLTPAGTYKLDSLTKYRLWNFNNAQQENADEVEDI